MKKLLCLLAFMGILSLSLPALTLAASPGAKIRGKGINYPAYLYPKGQRGEKDYRKLVRPYKAYKLVDCEPLGSHKYVPEW